MHCVAKKLKKKKKKQKASVFIILWIKILTEHSLQDSCRIATIFIPILQMRSLRHKRGEARLLRLEPQVTHLKDCELKVVLN